MGKETTPIKVTDKIIELCSRIVLERVLKLRSFGHFI